MKEKKLISQGDVTFIPLELFPKGYENNFQHKVKHNAIAYGEATGHCHALKEGKWETFSKNEWNKAGENVSEILIRIKENALIDHEEHEGINLEPGDYIGVIQQEIDPFEGILRRVVD